MNAVYTSGLTKTFNGTGGCRDIDLAVATGKIFGLLGPNGAGKSTLVKTLLGLQAPTGGTAQVLGYPPGTKAALARIGYLPELFRYHDWLEGRELLKVHGQLYRMAPSDIAKRIPEVLELVGLTGKEKQKIRTYSKGMQQRMGLACALLPDPDLLFLDEPTSALDPIGRKDVRSLLRYLKDQGTTIFLNSHLLSEVEMVCDQIGIIHNSRLVVSGSFEDLCAGPARLAVKIHGGHKPLTLPEGWDLKALREGIQILTGTVPDREAIADLVSMLAKEGYRIYEVKEEQNSLEELFVYWVNRQEEVGGMSNGADS